MLEKKKNLIFVLLVADCGNSEVSGIHTAADSDLRGIAEPWKKHTWH